MGRRIGVLALLGLLLCGLGTAEAKRYFEIDATRTYAWERHQLKVELEVEGKGRVETAPWNPCGGVPPGMSLVPASNFISFAKPGELALADSEGKWVRFCEGPPEVSELPTGLEDVSDLPTGLSLSLGIYGVSCKRYPEEGEQVRLRLSDQRTPATPGSPAVQEVSFSATHEMSGFAWNELRTFCLVESEGYEGPNASCAEYFDPDLCAKEYGTYQETIQMFDVRLLRTPTAACPAARKQRRQAERRLDRLRGKSFWKLRKHYRFVLRPRYVGECL